MSKSWFSKFGTNVGVVAPGGAGTLFANDGVWSTIWDGSTYDDGNGYEPLAGTSMATPLAAAVAALVAAKYGVSATPSFIYAKLKATADDSARQGSTRRTATVA